MINTVTNLFYVYLGWKVYDSARINKHGPIYYIVAFGLTLVGIGSWLFHMTLRYEFQLLDELPMVYFTWVPLAYLLGVEHKNYRKYIYPIIGCSMALFTLIYLFIWTSPTFQQIVFAVLNGTIIYKIVTMTMKYVTNADSRKFIYKLLGFSFGEAALAFFLWNIDTIFCNTWISIRRTIGLPLGIIFELHGWWHILMGLAMYHFILSTECLNTWFNHTQEHYYMTNRFGIPFDLKLKPDKEQN